jgi:hypothetical protein
MKLTGKIFKPFLFLWAVALLWICIGSLVNFHQHKIWGTPLLPELLYAKRDKEHSVDITKLIKPDLPKDLKPFTPDFSNSVPGSFSFELYCFKSSKYIITANSILTERFVLSNGLRAPPLS